MKCLFYTMVGGLLGLALIAIGIGRFFEPANRPLQDEWSAVRQDQQPMVSDLLKTFNGGSGKASTEINSVESDPNDPVSE